VDNKIINKLFLEELFYFAPNIFLQSRKNYGVWPMFYGTLVDAHYLNRMHFLINIDSAFWKGLGFKILNVALF
jgi:hypothetical protein